MEPADDYVTLREMANVKCHHRGISRLRSEELLLAAGEDGSFLIRDSETIRGAYTLCILHQRRVHQYRILPDNSGKIFVQAEKGVHERKFTDLEGLVQDYLQRGGRNGLVCALRFPVEVQECQDDDGESDEEDEEDGGVASSLAPGRPHTPPGGNSSGNSSAGSAISLDKPRRPQPSPRQIDNISDMNKPVAPHSGPYGNINGGDMNKRKSHPPVQARGISPGQQHTEKNKTLPASRTEGLPPVSLPGEDYAYIDEDVTTENNPVRRYVMSRFKTLDLSDCAGSFPTRLRDYIESGVFKDSTAVTSGDGNLQHLRHLMAAEVKELDRQVESFLAKIDICRQLFGPITTTPLAGNKSAQEDVPVLENVLDRLVLCKSAFLKLEKKGTHRLLDLAVDDNLPSLGSAEQPAQGPVPPLPSRKSPGQTPVIPSSSFDAKLMKAGPLGASHKVTLNVDVHQGKLFMVRPSKEILDDSNMFTHDRILQLIKSTTNNCRLDMRIAGHKNKDVIVFDDLRQRESFCQLMQQMKFMHSSHQEVDRLSVFIGTWNMGDEAPSWDIHTWLTCQGQGKNRDKTLAVLTHDVYVIGTQESALAEKDWVQRLQRALSECVGTDLILLTSATLWSIRIVVLIKPEYKHKISHIQTSTVKTGIANALGNKGASAVSFTFNGTSFCFINCHLTSGWEKNHRRIQNVRDIIKALGMSMGSKFFSDITNQFHHVFFLGDLNYRIDGIDSPEIIQKIKAGELADLRRYDQLLNSQNNNQCFIGFNEEEITFSPTYRIARGTKDKYEWQKVKRSGIRINAPSWCDRVVWKSYPDTYIINTSYGCVDTVFSSDHKPVFSSFDIGIINQFAGSNTVQTKSEISIIFEEVHAEVKTSTKDQFKLEFYSSCFVETKISNHSWQFDQPKSGFICPKWDGSQIPVLIPIVDDRDYLEDQHILIAVKSADGMESYGECVVGLKSMFAIEPQSFSCRLTHIGELTGQLTGKMYVKSKDSSRPSRGRRSYELIYQDTDKLLKEIDTLRFNADLSGYVQIDDCSSSPATRLPLSKTSSLKPDALKPDTSRPESRTNSLSMSKSMDAMALSSKHGLKPVVNYSNVDPPMPPGSYESIWLKSSGASPQAEHRGATSSPPKANFKVNDASRPQQETNDPKVLPRKPRLGQSSLNNPGKIANGDRAVPSGAQNEPVEYECVSFPKPTDQYQTVDKAKDSSQKLERKLSSKRNAVSDVNAVRDNPFYEHQSKDQSKKRLSSASSTGSEAPPMPERRYLVGSEPGEKRESSVSDYDTLRPPETISQWLTDLALPQYIQVFQAHGWDELDFISDLAELDLVKMKIDVREHKAKILASVSSFRLLKKRINSVSDV